VGGEREGGQGGEGKRRARKNGRRGRTGGEGEREARENGRRGRTGGEEEREAREQERMRGGARHGSARRGSARRGSGSAGPIKHLVRVGNEVRVLRGGLWWAVVRKRGRGHWEVVGTHLLLLSASCSWMGRNGHGCEREREARESERT